MRSLETVLTRKFFYILEEKQELYRMPIKDLSSVDIPFHDQQSLKIDEESHKRKQNDYKRITNDHMGLHRTDFQQEYENNDDDDEDDDDDIGDCKLILKHFNYSRYCDKKRTPLFSFQKTNSLLPRQVLSLASLKYFDKEKKTVFIKSVKYKEPLQLTWNGEEDETQARFQLVIGDDRLKKYTSTTNTNWVCNLVSIDFKFIYFYSTKGDDRFLSVTPLSPGWLPSLTKKDKTKTNLKTTTNYIRRSSENIDPRVAQFLSPLFLQEKNDQWQSAVFITDYKKYIGNYSRTQ